jgi:hypothetical protein
VVSNAECDKSIIYQGWRSAGERIIFSEDNEDRLRRVIIRALETVTAEERSGLFATAIVQAEDITILCDVLRALGGDKHPKGATRHDVSWAPGSAFDSVRHMLLARVRAMPPRENFGFKLGPDRFCGSGGAAIEKTRSVSLQSEKWIIQWDFVDYWMSL